jgi:hypothetical protein
LWVIENYFLLVFKLLHYIPGKTVTEAMITGTQVKGVNCPVSIATSRPTVLDASCRPDMLCSLLRICLGSHPSLLYPPKTTPNPNPPNPPAPGDIYGHTPIVYRHTLYVYRHTSFVPEVYLLEKVTCTKLRR